MIEISDAWTRRAWSIATSWILVAIATATVWAGIWYVFSAGFDSVQIAVFSLVLGATSGLPSALLITAALETGRLRGAGS